MALLRAAPGLTMALLRAAPGLTMALLRAAPGLTMALLRAVPELVAQLGITTTSGGGVGLLLRASRSGSGRSTSALDALSCVALPWL
jgi:hypothetical protein